MSIINSYQSPDRLDKTRRRANELYPEIAAKYVEADPKAIRTEALYVAHTEMLDKYYARESKALEDLEIEDNH